MAGDPVILDVDGVEVRVTSPDKVFFPKRGETKLDLVHYYLAVAEPFMNVVGGRPLLLERYPDGAGGKSFFQKRVPKGAPEWLRTTVVSTPNGTLEGGAVVVPWQRDDVIVVPMGGGHTAQRVCFGNAHANAHTLHYFQGSLCDPFGLK